MNKIDQLQKKIDKAKKNQTTNSSESSNKSSPLIDVGADLVAGVIVGVIIGLMFDKLFASKPLFLIICIILSVAAAFRSIWKKYIQ